MKKISLFLLVVFSLMISFGCSPKEPIEPLIDVTQFSNITQDQLTEIMGSPDETDTWSSTIGYKGEKYVYRIDDIQYNFELYERTVVKLGIFTNQYVDDLDIGVKLGDDVFDRFLIEKTNSTEREINNSSFIVWAPVNDSIDQVSAVKSLNPDKSSTRPISVLVFYDASYYREDMQ